MLFLLSLILVFGFAFFAANILDSKNIINNLIYCVLAAFAEVVLTFEILSLFSCISVRNVLFINFVLFFINLLIWIIRGRPVVKINYGDIFRKVMSVLKKDRILQVLSAGFLLMIVISGFLVIILPASDASSVTYHVARSLFWIEHGNLNHFNIADARALAFPVNSEILYAWIMLFIKKDSFLSGFSLLSFGLYAVSLYGIMSEITVSLRRKLWVLLIVSSFTAVITYLSSTETNIIVAALCMSGLYLLIQYLKYSGKTLVFMSALAFALSIGVKTSALFIFPAVILWGLFIGLCNKFEHLNKKFFVWGIYFFINFLIFSSYNYILNFINYGDFVSIPSLMVSHKNLFGIKGFIFNFLNYCLMMFKFSELDGLYNFSDFCFDLLRNLLKVFNQPYLVGHYTNDGTFRYIGADRSGLGLNGVLVFLPCLFYAFGGLFSAKNSRKFLISSFSVLFFISFLIMTYSVVYMSFNIRFIVTFALISAPVMFYSYNKHITFYKILVCAVAVFSFIYISTHITNKNVFNLINYFRHGYSVSKIRETARCSSVSGFSNDEHVNTYCKLRDYIGTFDKNNRILYFPQEQDGILTLKLLQFSGSHIDVDLIENLANIDLNKYNIVILLDNRQFSTVFHNLNKITDGIYRGEGFSCVYNQINGNMFFNTASSIPYLSICTVTDNFWQKRNFRLLDVLVFSEKFDGYEHSFKYYIYENLNKPVIK